MLGTRIESQIVAAANRIRSHQKKILEDIRWLGEVFQNLKDAKPTKEYWDYAISLTGVTDKTVGEYRRIYNNWDTIEKEGWTEFSYSQITDELLNRNQKNVKAYCSYNVQVSFEEKLELSESLTMEESRQILLSYARKRKHRTPKGKNQ